MKYLNTATESSQSVSDIITEGKWMEHSRDEI